MTAEDVLAQQLHATSVLDNPGHAEWTSCPISGPCANEARELARALRAAGYLANAEQARADLAAERARVAALIDEWAPCLDRHLGAPTCDHPGCVLVDNLRALSS